MEGHGIIAAVLEVDIKTKKHLFLVCTSSFGCSSVASAWLFIFAMTIDLHVMINVFFYV